MGDVATTVNQIAPGTTVQFAKGVSCTVTKAMTLTQSANEARLDSPDGTLISRIDRDGVVENHAIPKAGKSVLVGNDGGSIAEAFWGKEFEGITHISKMKALAASIPKIGFQCTMNPGIVDPSQLGQLGQQTQLPNDPQQIAAARSASVR